ncbi:MAG: 5-formyltetrahydrofolate cyclo-ligase [Johnsonella sp.]|nr:5-formyltetrahydrofolate cyclo-ligase [Johnsonella sp.]
MERSGEKRASKAQIRKCFLEKRESMEESILKEASLGIGEGFARLIEEELLSFDFFQKRLLILGYMPKGKEADLLPLYRKIWAGEFLSGEYGIDLAFPKVSGREMDFYLVESEEEFEVGSFGIREPAKALCQRKISSLEGALVILPGIAFSRAGYRIGYGAGYYDRYFSPHDARSKKIKAVGAAYEFQLTQFAPDPHDLFLDMIISEKARYLCPEDKMGNQ